MHIYTPHSVVVVRGYVLLDHCHSYWSSNQSEVVLPLSLHFTLFPASYLICLLIFMLLFFFLQLVQPVTLIRNAHLDILIWLQSQPLVLLSSTLLHQKINLAFYDLQLFSFVEHCSKKLILHFCLIYSIFLSTAHTNK